MRFSRLTLEARGRRRRREAERLMSTIAPGILASADGGGRSGEAGAADGSRRWRYRSRM